MSRTRLLLLLCHLIVLGGCTYPVRQETDRTVRELSGHPFDLAPPAEGSTESKPRTEEVAPADKTGASQETPNGSEPATDIQTTALMQAQREPETPRGGIATYDLKIPSAIPGSEVVPLKNFKDMTPEQKQRVIQQLYPALPPLPMPPNALPGPNGHAYTLSDLQRLAAENSPTLRQAVADVKSSEGALVQAQTYQNPTLGYSAQPTNNNSNAGAQGGFMQQHLAMFGKMKLAVASAQKDLDNSQLALRRARYDLSTNVRNAYFGLIVARETVRVNLGLARFTDEIYRLYTGLLASGIAAPYEPAALRSSAYSIRLAYQQAITSYNFAWIQLVATLGLPHLPLTEVAGRVDHLIPYYDYDKVLAHVLAHHTDVLTARNGVQKAQYNLKLAQITPYPDMDVYGAVWKESTIVPYTIFYSVQVGFPIPIWDQNKGNIKSAQAALVRAVTESQRVENALTNTLAANYTNYQNNLNALEYYRRYILPDQVRYYRGVFDRRWVDQNASPSDLVTAQAALATNVTTYLGILGQLWSSVVSVADPMQTDDLFQLAKTRGLPELPNLESLPRPTNPPAEGPVLPVPRPFPVPQPQMSLQTAPDGSPATLQSDSRSASATLQSDSWSASATGSLQTVPSESPPASPASSAETSEGSAVLVPHSAPDTAEGGRQ